ncbi:ribonuclease 3 isoform X1 [Salmo trutta]|uniref:Ribonuclease 3 n=1 Tax=Salmo trutta TaxID=8032 RepID=A0A673XJQ4_SALTR|nr:ribonuclease 3 isoform X1 [Salmo trutta]XP_029555684.1 ribonuclease 3 isoform X1 [Salmo trutta]
MSFHQGRGGGGCPRGRAPPGLHGGQHGSHQNYRPTNLGPPPPQPPMPPYHYDPQAQHSSSHSYGGQGNSGGGGYITAHSDYMSYPPPVPTQGGMTASPLSQCPVRPPFPNPQSHPNFPPPPLAGNTSGSSISGSPASAQSAYHYMMPSVPPPPFPHPPGMPPTMPPQSMSYHQPPYSMNYSHPPFPPLPNFSPGNYGSHQGPSSFKPDHGGFRHGPHGGGGQQYKAEKQQQMDDRGQRSPERGRGGRHDDHRQQKGGYAYSSRGGGGDRHKMDFPMNQRGKDRGRSPDRRRPEGGRHRSEYEQRGRTPPTRHRSRERSRERHRHRDSRRSQSPDRHRKRPRSRSGSRERKRGRWEEERDRRSDGPGMSRDRERSYTSVRSRDTEPEVSIDRDRDRERGERERGERERGERERGEREKGEGDEREEDELLKPAWIRCTHAENYYSSDPMDQVGDSTVVGTSKLRDLYERFEEELVKRQDRAQSARPKWDPPKTKLDEEPGTVLISDSIPKEECHSHSSSESDCESDGGGSTCSSSSDSDVFDVIAEIKRKKAHPDRLHDELWYNDPGQMNDGPLCKCSAKSRRTGIRHSIYPGEESVKECRPMNNNSGKLYHYRITVSPPTNFLTDRPTVVEYDDHEYLFEGFSLFSHMPLTNIPLCRVIRFNIDYTIHFIEEMTPENYCVKGLELFSSYLFQDILELYDWNLTGPEWDNQSPGCQKFHFMPRFVRFLPDGGKEVLSMHQVLLYLLRSSKPLVPEEEIADMLQWEELKWQKYAEECKGMIVTNPGMKPSSVRIDQLDREQFNPEVITFPIIVHFGIRPAQLSYAGDPQYQKLWKSYVKLRHLLANSPKVKQIDKQKLTQREEALQKIRQKNTMRREVTVELSSQGFWKTGIRSDLCQHAMMLPVLTHHIRYHQCLKHLDDLIGYVFKERCLLQLAMTHPSHHLNFGMNPDHARNSLSNCGIRQPKYGDRKVHHMYMRKKGINTLINIMSRLGQDDPSPSRINHNERLEFLGDAVVEFLTSVHLYYLFPSLEEGGLATYRTAIVQNQHLAMLAKKLELDRFMLYAHGPDLCRESDLRHAMANCFEALIGAVYLEGGLEESKQLFGRLLFNGEDLREVWLNYPPHPLQVQEPQTDRQLIETSPVLQKLTDFEDTIGVMFTHCRLLARAFTLRTVGFNHLTLGHNQRMEFLGDSIMQLVATEYLFIHFPDHHEGHLTLLRSSLVNNRTQAKVAEELGMQEFAITNDKTKRPVALRTKTLADLLESFIAALYIDKDLEYVHTFMNVCFFPRLKEFILNQDWNDPKSQLQQCCLTLRTEGKEPDIPLYKTLQTVGPSHARTYTVAVYFKGERIGCGKGPSIQQAEMGAAMDALEKYNFPQMAHQKRFIERKYRQELKEMRRERDRQEKEGDEPEDSRK